MISIYDKYRRVLKSKLKNEEIDEIRINIKKIADILLQLKDKNHEDKR